GHFLALVPGSLVVDVDRTTATLYLHVINVTDDADAETVRRDAMRTEKLFIRAIGNHSDLATVKAESRLRRSAGMSPAEREPSPWRPTPLPCGARRRPPRHRRPAPSQPPQPWPPPKRRPACGAAPVCPRRSARPHRCPAPEHPGPNCPACRRAGRTPPDGRRC